MAEEQEKKLPVMLTVDRLVQVMMDANLSGDTVIGAGVHPAGITLMALKLGEDGIPTATCILWQWSNESETMELVEP